MPRTGRGRGPDNGLVDGKSRVVKVVPFNAVSRRRSAGSTHPVWPVANIGVHGKPATLHLETLWSRDVTITTGLVDTYSTPTLLRLTTGGQLDASQFVTHHFAMDDMIEAYDTFARAADTGALKVVITPDDQPAT